MEVQCPGDFLNISLSIFQDSMEDWHRKMAFDFGKLIYRGMKIAKPIFKELQCGRQVIKNKSLGLFDGVRMVEIFFFVCKTYGGNC